ncbi:hypothetical protein V1264_002266 [Littorina saxatilis]|uniref:Amiloride-sensitive sodium channel n=1 Tax=Littorina saxatilis TaxID=31220 RepID=A0AAN9GQ12_9CAEN
MSGKHGKAAAATQRYAEDSSMGGVRNAARPGVFLKVVWVVVIVVCAVITVFSLHRLYLHHSRSRHSMTSYTNDAVAQDFPSVTLCNVNPVVSPDRLSEGDPPAARRRRAEYGMLTLSQFLQDYKMRKTNSHSEEDNRHLRHEYQTLVDQLSDQEREDAGHDLELMLSHCQLGDVPCDYRNFTRFYHHTFGNCFIFVADPRHLRVTKAGPQHGLTVELDTQSQEYTTQDEPGFVIVAHGSRDTVFPAEEGVFVPEGNAAYIALTKAERTRVTNTNCNGEDIGRDRSNIYAVDTRWRYSQRGCQHGCLQREVFRQCGCCDMDLPCPASFLDPTRRHTTSTTATTTTTPTSTTTSTTTTTTTRPTTPFIVGRRLMQERTAPASDPVQRCRPGHAEERCLRDVIRAYANGALPCQKECVPRCSVTTYSTRFSMSGLTSENQPDIIDPLERADGQTGGGQHKP